MQRILLIQTAFLGDVILTTPLIRAIRTTFPSAHLTVVVNKEAASILEDNPAIHEIRVLDKRGAHRGAGLWHFIRQIRSGHYDLLLCPHESHRSALIARFSGIPVRIGYTSAALSGLAYTKRVKRRMDLPETRRLLAFFQDGLDLPSPDFDPYPELFVPAEAQRRAHEILALHGSRKPILIAPSSVWATKRWPTWQFARLIKLLFESDGLFPAGESIFLVGSAADRTLATEILKFIKYMLAEPKARRVVDLSGKTSFQILQALTAKSALVVSNDSAPVHFAQASRTPVVCIMGPTTPALGYAPITPESRVAELDLSCRPCGTHGAHQCPLGHFRCMRDLEPEHVLDLCKELLAQGHHPGPAPG